MNNPKVQRRKEILQAAAELFAQLGYEKTSVSQIVKKVGVAQGTFYLYFDSKEHVRMGIHEQIINEIIETALIRMTGEPDPCKKIEHAVLSSIDILKKNQDLLRVIHREVSCEALYDSESREMNRKIVGPLCEILTEGMEQGIFAKTDPVTTAYLIIGTVERVTHSAILWEEPGSLDEITPVLVDFIQRGLMAK
ncbi:MAG: TetR/AcrR family transcriptional regulator [Clostridia bacterium]|nr:TetR/AcrR family transcriptional regulator [Clostridia bacterium]